MLCMPYTKAQKVILGFTALYVLAFAFYYVRNFNIEFIAYVGVIVAIFALLYSTLSATRFPAYILGGLSLWGLLHMMGGSIMTPDGVLYAWRMLPIYDGGGEFYILKFDQLVHGYMYAVVALLFLHLLRNYYGIIKNQFLLALIAVMASLGVSAINEIIEFIAVLTVPGNGVGGYFNTALDIVFNFLGALLATIGYYLVQRFKKEKD